MLAQSDPIKWRTLYMWLICQYVNGPVATILELSESPEQKRLRTTNLTEFILRTLWSKDPLDPLDPLDP